MPRVLIIDDDEDDQKLMERFLNENGVTEIAFASSGEDGVREVEENRPDIVILDTKLPGMDGFETCQAIKSIDGFQGKVIILTGVVDAVDAGKARRAGADEYCVKTSDGGPLMERIKKYL